MSAITGIYNFDQEPVNMEHGYVLMSGLSKYPADAAAVWHQASVFFGCLAQYVTPESREERLPFYDSVRRLAITADAIIDNRRELFERLQVEYGRRAGMTDSELILLAYDKWGTDSLQHLVGDFAFMIWDESKRRLFGARDFSGSRTLYYMRSRESLAFCTVMEPLLTLPYARRELNEQWLAQYLAVSGVIDSVDASLSPFLGIEQLPPSHCILVTDQAVKVERYCNVTAGEILKLRSDEEYKEAFQEVFRQSVQSRLRTFRGVGAHLSGGLDSGSVVSFAAEALSAAGKPLSTFSYIPPADFKDYTPKYMLPDERPYIQSTVRHVGGIQDHYLDFQGKNSFTEIGEFLDALEMPYKFFENSFWIKGMFERAREEGVGILLSGARGNFGISWGSAPDHYARLLKRLRWVTLYHELNQYSQKVGGARLRRLPYIAKVAFPLMNRFFSSDSDYQFPKLINPDFAGRTGVYGRLKQSGMDQSGWFSTTDAYKHRQRHFGDVSHWNTTNIMSAKLSLRYSLAQRDPTNDIRVIRFCLSVPEEQYVRDGVDRLLVRRGTEHLLPDNVRLNQRVRGVQGADWVHRMLPYWKEFIAELQQLSADPRAMQYLNGQVIHSALTKAKAGGRPELATDPDYRILMRSLILYRFIKNFT